MYSYYTTNNGVNEQDFLGDTIPSGSYIWMSATSDGTSSWAFVNGVELGGRAISYGVKNNIQNYEQAEVNSHDIWMGGGSGSNVQGHFQTTDNQWHTWNSVGGGTAWLNVVTLNSGSPAGWGYSNWYQQPNGGTEWGQGQSCQRLIAPPRGARSPWRRCLG